MKDTSVVAEWTAYQWMARLEGWGFSTNDTRSIHEAGNKVIKLAEQIKAERAVAGMQ